MSLPGWYVDSGIIPARAGFTETSGAPAPLAADHPRSRGVYPGTPGTCAPSSGSSPLARGLLSVDRVIATGTGIIPARAGFTRCGGTRVVKPKDHPRSRGVYHTRTPTALCPSGSSPLARGLRVLVLALLGLAGIIPARAGFTSTIPCRGGRAPDHPRSRGVYPVHTAEMTGCTWIIPARAGFTRADPQPAGPGADHPRSRGVYGCTVVHRGGAPGSSPLARGLPMGRVRAHPALPDHPRSRGVYGSHGLSRRMTPGSSPLARGLPQRIGQRLAHERIIPARAGFTGAPPIDLVGRPDHPRSRGVYARRPTPPSAPAGSSPLARGLHFTLALFALEGRIIPARAGFT